MIMKLENYILNYELIKNYNQPLILFLHGFMGSIEEFDTVTKVLKDNFSYLLIDLPGHGKTQVLGGDEYYTIQKTATAIIELIEKLKINQCYLAGYSMGGRLALYLTLHFPQYFSRVILESASPGLATETERTERIKRDHQIARKLERCLSQPDFSLFLSNWYRQPIFGSLQHHPEFHYMLENRLQNNPLELAKSLKFMGNGSQPSLWEILPQNQVPLLLVVGEQDDKFVQINQDMVQLCPVAQLQIISNAAHNIHWENTSEFVRYLQYFLQH